MNIVLNLTIKRRWFDMINSGVKREEYRIGNAQVAKAYDSAAHRRTESDLVMVLRNGYRMDSPALVVRIVGFSFRTKAEHPEWGEPTGVRHYAVLFDKVIARGTYKEVKEVCHE